MRGAIRQLLRGMIRGLSIKGQRRQPVEIAFYVTILNMARPLIHNFVAMNLGGPSLSKTCRDRVLHAWFRIGALEPNLWKVFALMATLGLQRVPLIMSEDATAAAVHTDVVLREGKYLVYGLNGRVLEVTCLEDLIDGINTRGLAKSFYEFMAVSVAPHGIYLPAEVLAIDNTKETINDSVIKGELEADGRGRGGQRGLQHGPLWRPCGCVQPVVLTIDHMHIGWRLRRLFLDPGRFMKMGPYLINSGILRTLSKRGVIGLTGAVRAVTTTHDALRGQGPSIDGSFYGTYLYVTFMHYFLRISHLTDLPLRDIDVPYGPDTMRLLGVARRPGAPADPRLCAEEGPEEEEEGRDCVDGRFFGQDVREEVKRLTLEEQDRLSEDDYVAVLEELRGRTVMRVGLVEAMSRITSGKKKGLETATRMEIQRRDRCGTCCRIAAHANPTSGGAPSTLCRLWA
ncbi:hypothetical protein HYH03_012216 [Edaphochlamys debaryana]|uniref:Uncharacterized protein n=1 Tax=Edaphochlamys debaryana TaxID=47281 RepID=A0A836BU52_9CHLO|nr:hypothetical protein HYH03_012216 [Edaphochlamys debaryana]|eukprot:KAG2489191.1 hypothetical protein HYH03_012216 [Edaphochlamys debaryana]